METILGFYGDDRDLAWDEAMRFAQIIERKGLAGRFRVRAKWHRHTVYMPGEYVVTLTEVEAE